jgi:NAD+ synthase (glutamine-hydrolysing)
VKSFKLALAQINSKPGDIKGNTLKILDYIKKARKQKVDLVVFPELAITGYLCMDLFLDNNFILENLKALEKIKKASKQIAVAVGFVNASSKLNSFNGFQPLYNAAVLFQNGAEIGVIHKINLPDYDIFSEKRYFTSAIESKVFEIILNKQSIKLGLQICEDTWDENYLSKPTQNQVIKGAEVILNLSASPYWQGKITERETVISDKVNEFKIPFAMCNCVGSFDGYDGQIIFDGRSLVYNQNGQKVFSGKDFSEDLVISNIVIDKEKSTKNEPILSNKISPNEELHVIYKAIIFSIKTYFEKAGFKKILIGLSGGIDSSVVASIAVAAVGKNKVEGILMPSQFTSHSSNEEALTLAKNLGINTRIISIEDSFEFLAQRIFKVVKSKFEIWQNFWFRLWNKKSKSLKIDLALENLQARIRGNILMTISNRENALVLNTSNKTEMALGYGTLYGDMIGGLAPISDLDKSKVYELGQYINKTAKDKIIPENVFLKPATAELNLDQTDEKNLGANYEILSPLVEALINQTTELKVLNKKYGKKLVEKIQTKIKNSEFKRRQSPPGIKLTKKAFGIGRRMPF